MSIVQSGRLLQVMLSLALGVFVCTVSSAQSNTLSALTLTDGVGNELTLNPNFASSTTSYSSSVAYAVNQITIAVTKIDNNASVVYLDGTDTALDDAATGTNGFQIDLAQGVNTIKVEVTDANASIRTYTLTVTRNAAQASLDALLSNLDEQESARIAVGRPHDSSSDNFTQAIRFQTGNSERGYNLNSVKVVLANAELADEIRIRIFGARTIGTPHYSLLTLSNPTIANGIMTFTAPASATLRKDAGYFVVIDSTAAEAGNDYEIRGTASDSLNTVATG